MPGKILGIDISEQNISAVQIISGLKGYQAVSCFSAPVQNNDIEKALAELAGRTDMKSDKCLLSIPLSNTSFRNINTPFKDKKKIRQTLPFEMETLVPFAVDEMIIDYIHTDETNSASILTAAIKKDHISNFIEYLKTAGIEPDIIDIRPVPAVTWLLNQERTPGNGIYLDLEPEHPCIVIFQGKKVVLIRELPCSFTGSSENAEPEESTHSLSEPVANIINSICREAERTLYSFNSRIKNSFTAEKVFFGGRFSVYSNTSAILNNLFKTPAERINISKDSRLKIDSGFSGIYKPALMDHALAMSLRENKKSTGFNFRRGEFALKRRLLGPGKDIRRIALLFSVFVVLMIINTGVDYYHINKRHAIAEEYFNKEFEKRLPREKGIKGTKLRMQTVQQKLEGLKNPSSQGASGASADQKILEILAEISKRVSPEYDFYVNSLIIRNNEVTISATTDTYPTVTKITNALKESDLFKEVENSIPGLTKDRVKFDLQLKRAD
ncbi:MAG: pilus assembly protein PilM [Deltaproteobacteria bacterium]|nr:pilus assembly protein PilM [Deltaproteobacteria bacterium]